MRGTVQTTLMPYASFTPRHPTAHHPPRPPKLRSTSPEVPSRKALRAQTNHQTNNQTNHQKQHSIDL